MRPLRGRQRGVAVITALLLTTLAVTIVTSLFWLQQVQVRSMENQRLHLQTKWILRGALDWARLILRQDGLDNPNWTALDGVWATPLAETRLDQYIERERVEGENFDATLAGQIVDAQSRFNLNNLAKDGKTIEAQVLVFGRLLKNQRLDPGLAQVAAEAIAQTQPAISAGVSNPPGSGQAPLTAPAGNSAPMAFLQVDDLLSVPGFTPQALESLRDFLVVLPKKTPVNVNTTPVNVNTAPAEVLAAVVDFSVAEAAALVLGRQRLNFKNTQEFAARLEPVKLPQGASIAVKSSYFLVTSRVRLDRAALDVQALIERDTSPSKRTTLLSIREN